MSRRSEPPRIPGYSVDRLLGTGGLGAVWLGTDPSGRTVAVKVVEPKRAIDASLVDRLFRREALAALHLDHPGLVRALDAGSTVDGRPFIAFEYLEGRTLLAGFREGGALPTAEVVDLGRALADALDHAHRRGVVHGDVSPANVILSSRGPVLLDLGLVRELAAAEDPEVFATPGYTDPAVIRGAPRSPASDLYSLGMTLAAAWRGRPLLATAGFRVYLEDADRAEPELPPVEGETPADTGLRMVLARLVRRDPAERYGSASAVRLDLEAIRAGERPMGAMLALSAREDVGAAGPHGRRGRWGVVVAAMLVLGGVAWAVLRDASPGASRLEPTTVAAPAVAPPAGDPGNPTHLGPDDGKLPHGDDSPDEAPTSAPGESIATADPTAAPEPVPPVDPPSLPGDLVAAVEAVTAYTPDAELAALESALAGVDASALPDPERARWEGFRERVGDARRRHAAASREAERGDSLQRLIEDLGHKRRGPELLAGMEAILERLPELSDGPVAEALRRTVEGTRRAETALRRALAPVAGRTWATVRDGALLVQRFEAAPDPWVDLRETQILLLSMIERNGDIPFRSTAEDVLLLGGDPADGEFWLFVAGSHAPGNLGANHFSETVQTLIRAATWGWPQVTTELPGFRIRSGLALRPVTAARSALRSEDPILARWYATVNAKDRTPAVVPASPDRDRALAAYLADDLPGAWAALRQAVDRFPGDPEAAVLGARVLRDAVAPLPTVPVLVFALSEARRAMDLDPTLPAAPPLVAELAMELERTRPLTFERRLRPLILLAIEASLRLGRETPTMLLHLGRARHEDGDIDGARSVLRRARDLLGDRLPDWAAEILDSPR